MKSDARLRQIYSYSAAAYRYAERHCHDELEPRQAVQRDITRWSFELIRAVSPAVQSFIGLLVQYESGQDEPGQVATDHLVVLHPDPLSVDRSFDVPFQPAGPFMVTEYIRKYRRQDRSVTACRDSLQVPYFMAFAPDLNEFSVHRLMDGLYEPVAADAFGRFAVPELGLAVGLHDGWLRYWFRGELVPLPAELLRQRDTERQARHAAEAELARLRDELAKARGGG